MNSTDRKNVTKDQINRFFSSYYSEWRVIQLLTIKKNLTSRYEYYKDIVEEIKLTDGNAGENTIAQEIRNGLLFESIAISIQYIEDLFALISASKNKDYFIRNIIKYKAGAIENLIKTYKFSNEHICKSFHFPYYPDEEYETEKELEIRKDINNGIDILKRTMFEIIEHYKKFNFFYKQYKHGLTVALRPYAKFEQKQIENDKNKEIENIKVVALDNINFKDAPVNQYGNKGYLMMPCFTDNVKKNMDELQKENNLLRYVNSPPDTTIDTIIEIVKKTRKCIHVLLINFTDIVNDNQPIKRVLPLEFENLPLYEFSFKTTN